MVRTDAQVRMLAALTGTFCLVMAWAAAAQDVEVAARVAYTESPTVDREGNVYFTESVSQTIRKLSPDGVLSVYRDRFRGNGLLVDPQGRLITLGTDTSTPEGKPSVTRTDLRTGRTEILADSYEGKPLRAPNDVTMDGKGRLYFSDRSAVAVYRIDVPGKVVQILGKPDVQWPNGLQVSPDDKILYVVETNQAKGGARRINAYDLAPDGTVSNMRVHYDFYPGRSADGMSIDSQGNLYAAAGLHSRITLATREGSGETMDTKSGVYVISPQGTLIRFVDIPEDIITNTGFGGPDMRTLYVTAGDTLFKMRTDVSGLPR